MNKGAIYEYHFLCGPLRSEQQSLGGNPSSEERTSLLLPPALERPEHTQHRRSVSTSPLSHPAPTPALTHVTADWQLFCLTYTKIDGAQHCYAY